MKDEVSVMTNSKMTNTQKFAEVINYINGVECSMTVEEMVEFLKDRADKAVRKPSPNSKPSAKDNANADAKNKILDVLANSDKAMTIGEICVAIGDPSSQHVTALVTSMCDTEKKPNPNATIKREMNGRKAVFSLV